MAAANEPPATSVWANPSADPDPDADYCEFVAGATEVGHDLETPSDLRPDLLRARELLLAVRAAGRLSSTSHLPPLVADRPLPGRRVGRFLLIRELGRGGSGAVFGPATRPSTGPSP